MSAELIFDQVAADLPGLVCPICGHVEFRGLQGTHDRGDIDVCTECWMRGFHWPDLRAERSCVDCGKFCFGMDAMVLVVRDGVIQLCRQDYERRVGIR